MSDRKSREDEESREGPLKVKAMGGADRDLAAGFARATYSKQLDKDLTIEPYLQIAGGKARGDHFRGPVEAGVSVTKRFAGGGEVGDASRRADGAAQRGKTRGRLC